MSQPGSFIVKCAICLLSGALYAAAFPPLGWRWAVIPGIAGLIFAVRGERGTRARALGLLFGLISFGWSLSWLFQIFGGMALVLYVVLAAFPALFADFQGRAAARRMKGWTFAAFTAVNWCGWEFIRAELFPLKFPWMTAGLAVAPNPLLPWIGVYGLGLPVVFLAALLVAERIPVRIGAVIAVIATGIGLRFSDGAETRSPGPGALKVGGLQMETVTLTEFLAGTRELPPDVRHVVWPEYAIPYDLRHNKRDWELVRTLCRERGITLTLGTQSAGEAGAWRNIALTLDADGTRGEHTKVHTVHFFDDGTPGTTALPVSTGHGKIGTPVCFDCDYEGVVRKMTAAGAEMFIVPIMDAVSWTPRQQEQHAELFRIRACENGRWMFVGSSSGVSQIISPAGKVTAFRGPSDQGELVGTIEPVSTLTFYTRAGWIMPWIVLGLAALLWIWLLLPPRRAALPGPP